MSEATDRSRILEEASGWFTTLKRPTITAQALQDFDVWKRDPAHAAAFAEIKRTWATEEALTSDRLIRAATQEALAAHPARPVKPRRGFGYSPLGIALASLAVVG